MACTSLLIANIKSLKLENFASGLKKPSIYKLTSDP